MDKATSNPQTLMSEDQLKEFLEAVKADASLQERLKAAADVDAVVAVAKSAGFVISADALQRAQAEVSEEELEGVSGGTWFLAAEVGGHIAAHVTGEKFSDWLKNDAEGWLHERRAGMK